MTSFATSYLNLGCLDEKKGALLRIFTFDEWKSSKFAKTKDEKFIENVILDKLFWRDTALYLRGCLPSSPCASFSRFG